MSPCPGWRGATLVLLLASCGESVDLAKHEVRYTGPGSFGEDPCETQSWYDDGECDEFCPRPDGDCDATLEQAATRFLEDYVEGYAAREKAVMLTNWDVSVRGSPEDYQASQDAQLGYFQYHLDPDLRSGLRQALTDRHRLAFYTRRSLEVAEPNFVGMDLPVGELAQLLTVVQLRNEALDVFNTYQCELAGKEEPCSALVDTLPAERDVERRRAIWESSRGTGPLVAPKVKQAVGLLNAVARAAGYSGAWEYMLRQMGDQDPDEMVAILDEVDRLTAEPYRRIKQALDQELAARYGIAPEEVAIWHYDDPFFQSAPWTAATHPDTLVASWSGERIVQTAVQLFGRLGVDVADVLPRSDLYERQGKWPGAFMTDIDREGDIRILLNVAPTYGWVSTAAHELGHAADHKLRDPRLPFMLRTACHILTTEAVALFFEDQTLTPEFLGQVIGVEQGQLGALTGDLRTFRRRNELVFARFVLVMFHFERALYDNPEQDLNRLWWDLVERYQLVRRPPGREQPDWACKSHFTSSPVYYHNYLLGKLLAAQLRRVLARGAELEGSTLQLSVLDPRLTEAARQLFGSKVFPRGRDLHHGELVEHVTGEPLQARYFADELE